MKQSESFKYTDAELAYMERRFTEIATEEVDHDSETLDDAIGMAAGVIRSLRSQLAAATAERDQAVRERIRSVGAYASRDAWKLRCEQAEKKTSRISFKVWQSGRGVMFSIGNQVFMLANTERSTDADDAHCNEFFIRMLTKALSHLSGDPDWEVRVFSPDSAHEES